MFHYRRFRNQDPPALMAIWNDSLLSRGTFPLHLSSTIESFLLSKPYFDPEGLILAFHKDEPAGFALAGFGCNANETDLDRRQGVICFLMVRPQFRRNRLGTELLKRAEAYLRQHGAINIFAGPIDGLNPFGLGLYGGSYTPGFLNSDGAAGAFLEANGYEGERTTLVMQRSLDKPVQVVDARFTVLRKRYTIERAFDASVDSWWRECVLGPIEPIEFGLLDSNQQQAARARVWEMEGFSWRWGKPTIGLLDLVVRPELRRRGLAKLLFSHILRYLKEQYFAAIEAQIEEQEIAGVELFHSLGFETVDAGRTYRKVDPTLTPSALQ